MSKIALKITLEFDHDNKVVALKASEITPPEPKGELAFLYENIGCSMVEVVNTPKGDIWADEEGLFKSNNLIGELLVDYQSYAIVGNMIISKGVGPRGETIWFDSEQDKTLLSYWKNEVLPTMKLKGITNP